VVWYQKPTRAHTSASEFDIRKLNRLPRVDIVLSYVGADGCMIDAAVAAGAEAVVMAAAGAGRPTPLEDAALSRAQGHGVVICIASRVGSGRVVRSPVFRKRGFVAADNLVAWKARVLLALALTVTRNPDTIQEMFGRY
jgi:L-asparaginase